MRHLIKAITLVAIIAATDGVRAEEWNDCERQRNNDLDRIIAFCTKLIETPGIDPLHLGRAFSRRGYGYDGLGQYQRAIRDYDEAIRILLSFQDPDALRYRAIAYNNRAEAYLVLGKPSQGLPDADKAVQLAPREPHFYSTRGRINQSLGDQPGAIRDHDAALARGGTRWVKIYQCGLRLAQLYHGQIDGILRSELRTALRMCVDKGRACDPAPAPDPECPDPVG